MRTNEVIVEVGGGEQVFDMQSIMNMILMFMFVAVIISILGGLK